MNNFANSGKPNFPASRGFNSQRAGSRPFPPKPYGPRPQFRKPFVKLENTYGFNRNEYIKALEVMVIDPNGEQLGLMNTAEAIRKARDDFNLDLVEVAPNATPPVCKITDWSKFRYEQSKKRNTPNKSIDVKGMWFSPVIGEGDLNHKVERVEEFLSKKHPVKIEIRVRGRVQRDLVISTMTKVLSKLEGKIKLDSNPKFEGKNYSVMVYPVKLKPAI